MELLGLSSSIDIFSALNKISQAKYYNMTNKALVGDVWSIDYALALEEDLYKAFSVEDIRKCEKANFAYFMRLNRLKKHIRYMTTILKPCYFLTLTFTIENQNNKSNDTKRKRVAQFLKSISNLYIANVDYGTLNETLHYHAIIQCDKPLDLKYYVGANKKGKCVTRQTIEGWCYGILDVQPIDNRNENALSKYLNKFLNHTKKQTTNLPNEKILYSRGFPLHLNDYDNTIVPIYDFETGEIVDSTTTQGDLNKFTRLSHLASFKEELRHFKKSL